MADCKAITNTIQLTNDQVKTVLCAIDGALEDYYNEIRKYANDDSGAYCSMMDTFEKTAGVKALIEAQVAQQ